jgi:hypothetical protein
MQQVLNVAGGNRVEHGGRSRQQQDIGVDGQCTGNAQLLLLAGRQRAWLSDKIRVNRVLAGSAQTTQQKNAVELTDIK